MSFEGDRKEAPMVESLKIYGGLLAFFRGGDKGKFVEMKWRKLLVLTPRKLMLRSTLEVAGWLGFLLVSRCFEFFNVHI